MSSTKPTEKITQLENDVLPCPHFGIINRNAAAFCRELCVSEIVSGEQRNGEIDIGVRFKFVDDRLNAHIWPFLENDRLKS